MVSDRGDWTYTHYELLLALGSYSSSRSSSSSSSSSMNAELYALRQVCVLLVGSVFVDKTSAFL